MVENKEEEVIVITNGKGGAAKSTTAFQVAATRSLSLNKPVILYELDDENNDSASFSDSVIEREQIKVGDYSDLTNQLRSLFLGNDKDTVIDIGGNRTTTEFLKALGSSRMYRKVDLYIIPITSGSQDVKNARDTYDAIREFDKDTPIIFSLSRCRHESSSPRIKFQYSGFFNEFKKATYFTLRDSDSVDLSRMFKKSIFELANDAEAKLQLENKLDESFDNNDNEAISKYSVMLEILDECSRFNSENLAPAHETITKVLG